MRRWGHGSAVTAPAGVLAISFVAGAVPFSYLAAYGLRRIDLRDRGTGTVSATGVWQVAGLGPLVVTGVLDVAKGSVGPLLAGPGRPALAAAASAAAVAGHNWSPFLRGAGGRGLSVAIGALLATEEPAGAAVLVAGLGLGKLARQTGLGCLVADLVLLPVLRRTGGGKGTAMAAAVLIPMLAKRLLGNGPARSPATYAARLLFDRDDLTPQRKEVPGGGSGPDRYHVGFARTGRGGVGYPAGPAHRYHRRPQLPRRGDNPGAAAC